MPLRVQVRQVNIGATCAINFTEAIVNYLVGVSTVQLEYPTQRNVAEVSVSLASNMPNQNTLVVTVNGVMRDASGYNLDPVHSLVGVVALVWVEDATFVTTGTAKGIANGTSSPLIPIPAGSAINASQAILTGFEASYTNGDSNVHSLCAFASTNFFSQPSSGAAIVSTVGMSDAKGLVAAATIDGAYICGYDSQEFVIIPWFGTVTERETVTVPFGQPMTSLAVFLTGFSFTYDAGEAFQVLLLIVGTGIGGFKLSKDNRSAQFPVDAYLNSGTGVIFGTLSLAVVGIL